MTLSEKHVFGLILGFGMGMQGCDAQYSNVSIDNESYRESSDKIIGGILTDAFPAVGAITNEGYAHCTGTLVGEKLVVTAAHCVTDVSASSLQFVIGASIFSAGVVERHNVASLKAHPNYNDRTITNDIGILILATKPSVAPLGVVQSMDTSWVGRSLTFVGYGVSNGRTQRGAGYKRSVDMPVSFVDAKTFGVEVAGRNTCNGDSGGPALYIDATGAAFVAGVTSYGDETCVEYGVDTRVDAFADFVGANTPTDGPPGPPVDPCNGETFVGRCEGDTVIWCENSTVKNRVCRTPSRVCGFSSLAGYYACVRP